MRKLPVVPICRNPAALISPPNQIHICSIRCPSRGAFARSSRTLGAGCGGRGRCQRRETLLRGRRSRVVLTPRRWRQVCGIIRKRRWQESPVTGESSKETVKTIARGMPGDPGVTVVTMLVCFFTFAHKAAGAPSARHSLRPLILEGRLYPTTRALFARREGGGVSPRHCEEPSDEAIHFFLVWRDGLLRGACDWARIRATRWLAMTGLRAKAPHPRCRPGLEPGPITTDVDVLRGWGHVFHPHLAMVVMGPRSRGDDDGVESVAIVSPRGIFPRLPRRPRQAKKMVAKAPSGE
jgi:hypothetical protein